MKIIFSVVVCVGLVAGAREVSAQAWVLPSHVGAITVVLQEIDHVGRMWNDGTRLPVGKAVNYGADVELDYAFTDRLSISAGLPYIYSKYTDPLGPPGPPIFNLTPIPYSAVDSCHCWQKAFADFDFKARYNLVNRNRVLMVTPFVGLVVPSHKYDWAGEAVVGRGLTELRLGVDAGRRLDAIHSGLSVEASYRYTIVKRILDIPNNRSDGSIEVSLPLTRHFAVRQITAWQRTHGGLVFPTDIDGYPDRVIQFHRLLRDNYLQLGGGVSYSLRDWDLTASALGVARGSNSHDVHVFSVTIGRLFDLGK